VDSDPAPWPVEALCVTLESHFLLVFGEKPAGRFPSFGPPVYLRFAFAPALAGQPLIPARVVDDRGLEIAAPEAYTWIESRGTLFPRADVIGLTPAGQPVQCFVKELDLAAPPAVYAARSAEEFPGFPLALVLAADDAPALPPLLARAVPRRSLDAARPGESPAALVRRLLE
jgi:hypothetical protein